MHVAQSWPEYSQPSPQLKMKESCSAKSYKAPVWRTRHWFLGLLMVVVLMLLLMFSLYDHVLLLLPWASENQGEVSVLTNLSTQTAIGEKYSFDQAPPSDPAVERVFVAYPHHYHFIMEKPDKCQEQKPFLVIIVPVEPNNLAARNAIRRTWGANTTVLGRRVSIYFLLGLTNDKQGAEKLQESIVQEQRQHEDLLQADFLDTYHNLTIKTMLMLKWYISRCTSSSYLLKIDSDMFLNLRNLIQMLAGAPRHNFMTGQVARGSPVLRDPSSKWFLPKEAFPESSYPPYALGLGYVVSLDLAQKLIEASKHIKALYIEDVHLGLCMRHLGIEPLDPPNGALFKAYLPAAWNSCYWTHVVTTILNSPQQLLDVWKEYQTKVQLDC